MTLPALPKNPKPEDLVPVLDQLDQRIATLEAYVKSNDARISTLETYAAQIIAERTARIEELEVGLAEQRETTKRLRHEQRRMARR